MFRLSWGFVPLAAAGIAVAQSHDHAHGAPAKPAAAPPAASQPSEPKAEAAAAKQAVPAIEPVPAKEPAPALPGYRRFGDAPAIDWRSANAQVRETGGHMGAMKEAPR